jgi:hypothetical protein
MKVRIVTTTFVVLVVVLAFGSAYADYNYTTLDFPGASTTDPSGIL